MIHYARLTFRRIYAKLIVATECFNTKTIPYPCCEGIAITRTLKGIITMQTKKFHLGDVLSITTSYLISPRGFDGVYDILNFMTGDNLFTHQLPRACNECKPYLVEQFPQLASTRMSSAIAKLRKALKPKTGKADTKKIVADWLAKQVTKYGKMFVVKPIPSGAHEVKDPIVELVEMRSDPKKIIVVRV